jgi:hypothetical protein
VYLQPLNRSTQRCERLSRRYPNASGGRDVRQDESLSDGLDGLGAMDHAQRERLIELITHPPPDSKLAAARAFGIDLTLLVRKLELTPTARLQELAAAQDFVQELRRGKKTVGR